jgi:DNA repair exonuclease SbcCD ATPase subunit
MSRILDFSQFKHLKPLIEKASEDEIDMISSIKSGSFQSEEINEGLFGRFLSSFSSSMFGVFSKSGQVDELRSQALKSEKDYYTGMLDLEDQIESIKSDLKTAQESGNQSAIDNSNKALASKTKESENFKDVYKTKMRKIEDLIDVLISKSSRLRDYYEAGKADDDYILASYKYKISKERSQSPEKIEVAKKEAEDAKREAAETLDNFKKKVENIKKKTSKSGEEDEEETAKIDTSVDKKVISSKRPETIIKRKKNLRVEIADLQEKLEELLDSLGNKIEKGKATQKAIDAAKREALEISTVLDSKVNLLNIYIDLGKSEDAISKNTAKEAKITEITNKINQAVTSGGDPNTGSKKIVTRAFTSGVNKKKLIAAISEIGSSIPVVSV